MHSNDIIYSFLRTAIKDGIYVAVNIYLPGCAPPRRRSVTADYAMKKATALLIFLILIPSICLAQDTTELRQQMAGFLRSGADASILPDHHPLALLKRAPVTATVAWLLFHNNQNLLVEFYPLIDEIVMDYFSDDRMGDNNFISGYRLDDRTSGASCPCINALAALDIHSLSLIASAAGRFDEAIGMRQMSRNYCSAITEYFFDHKSGLFLPVAADGSYAAVYQPGQLLPLILDGGITGETRVRIAERLLYEVQRGGGEPAATLWNEPGSQEMIVSILSGRNGLPPGRFSRLSSPSGINSSPASWKALWKGSEDPVGLLFPCCDELFVTSNLIEYLDKKNLMLSEKLDSLTTDFETVKSILSAGEIDMEKHIHTVTTVNRMLVSLSRFNITIGEKERIWKIFNEYKWDELSLRDQKRIAQAFADSPEELLEAKRLSSSSLAGTTGLHADVRLPDSPVPAGRKIDIEARMWSERISAQIDRVYLQAGANRWKFTDSGNALEIIPGATPIIWKRSLGVAPGSGPGLETIPVFFDFMSGGRRIEIHSRESVVLTSGYDISLNYPAGRRLGESGLPLNITIRYGTEKSIQGSVDGVFFSDLGCIPELPAKFIIRESTDATTLPIIINPPETLPPGRYPFMLTVKIDGSVVASFEDELVKPVRWLHLGPLPNRNWVIENATSLQNNLYDTHTLSSGHEIRWSPVPNGAFDEYGSVLPDRLYGSGSDRCMLLYTVVTSERRRKVHWTIRSENTSNFWINEAPLLVDATAGRANSGTTMLREGRNFILLSSAWNEFPNRVMLELSDENGLPLAETGNDIDGVLRDYALIDRTVKETTATSSMTGQPREVTFALNHASAREISLIGEFNNWSAEAAPMKPSSDGIWRVTVLLPPGTYSYKFLIDRKQKLEDPEATGSEPDGFGGVNSVIKVK
jgi:hypothetical protein